MAVLCNNVIAGASIADDASGGDDTYKIEKSLRFNNVDQSNLKRTPSSSGNTRKWTISVWVKRSMPDAADKFFMAGDTNDETGLRFDGDALHFYRYDHPSYSWQLKTNALFRDPSAWYHITAVYDSTNSFEADRLRLFVNGERQTSFSTAAYPSQYVESTYNTSIEHTLGKLSNLNNTESFDGLMAIPQCIDGLALSPAAFGSFDSSGNWNPKTFALPAPNDGSTWSNGLAKDDASDTMTNAAKAFNGDISDGVAGLFGGWTFTPPSPIKNVYSLRFHSYSGNTTGTVKLNGTVIDTAANFGASISRWYDVSPEALQDADFTFTSLSWNRQPGAGGNNDDYLYAVEVNGQVLIDGLKNPELRKNKNNGTNWTSSVVRTGSVSEADIDAAFDGSLNTVMVWGADGDTFSFKPGWTGLTSIRIFVHEIGSTSAVFKLNNVDYTAAVKANGVGMWWTAPNTVTTIDSTHGLYFNRVSNSDEFRIKAIEIDGHILIDSSADNSFQLKFNDTSSNNALGKTSIQKGEIASANGAHPILNTSDDLGQVVSSGNRTDSNSGNLELALPFNNSTSDVSSNSIGMTNSGSTNTTSNTKFYGNARDFDGSNDTVANTSTNSDLDWNSSSSVCYEWWAKSDDTSQTGTFLVLGEGTTVQSYYQGFVIKMENGGFESFVSSNNSSWNVVGNTPVFTGTPDTEWHHYAWTYDASADKIRTFQDGKLVETVNNITAGPSVTESTLTIGGGSEGNNVAASYFNGQVSDFRFYKGTAKYTTAFTVPKPNDFTVSNLTYAVEAGDTGPWTTEFKTDGSSWSGANSLTISSGSTHDTNGNNNLFHCDTSLLGNYDLTITDTGGASGIHFYTSTDGSSYSEVSNSYNAASLSLTNVGTPSHTYSRYIRIGGTGSGNVTITITGRLNLTGSGTAANASDIDASVDTPTNYGEDTGAGGEVRGNYCTMNPLHGAAGVNTGTRDLSQGNLTYKHTKVDGYWRQLCTMAAPAGKWYWEFTCNDLATPEDQYIGLVKDTHDPWSYLTEYIGFKPDGWSINQSGNTAHNGSFDVSGVIPAMAKGDVIQIAVDNSAGKLWFGKNGTWGTVSSNTGNPAAGTYPTHTNVTGPIIPATSFYKNNTGGTYNFGQRAFKYTAPSGFKCICTQNLPDTFSGDELNNPSKYFDMVTWSGDSVNNKDIVTSTGFAPDLLWIKDRNQAYTIGHRLYDRIRGAGVNKHLDSSTNKAEGAENDETYGYVSAFTSNGFTATEGTSDIDYVNKTDVNYVAWAWDAGTTAATPSNSYDITPDAQWVNATAGFSITKYTGNGTADQRIPHGQAVKPDFAIIKKLSSAGTAGSWMVKHVGLSANNVITLDNPEGENADSGWYGIFKDHPDQLTVKVSTHGSGSHHTIQDEQEYILYTWAAIPGYSAFGSYGGNSSADGTFIYTGFHVKYVLIKRTDSTSPWTIFDSARGKNENNVILEANTNNAEDTPANRQVDLLSNGFKNRATSGNTNTTGGTYIYAAFAEHPFKLARAA